MPQGQNPSYKLKDNTTLQHLRHFHLAVVSAKASDFRLAGINFTTLEPDWTHVAIVTGLLTAHDIKWDHTVSRNHSRSPSPKDRDWDKITHHIGLVGFILGQSALVEAACRK